MNWIWVWQMLKLSFWLQQPRKYLHFSLDSSKFSRVQMLKSSFFSSFVHHHHSSRKSKKVRNRHRQGHRVHWSSEKGKKHTDILAIIWQTGKQTDPHNCLSDRQTNRQILAIVWQTDREIEKRKDPYNARSLNYRGRWNYRFRKKTIWFLNV